MHTYTLQSISAWRAEASQVESTNYDTEHALGRCIICHINDLSIRGKLSNAFWGKPKQRCIEGMPVMHSTVYHNVKYACARSYIPPFHQHAMVGSHYRPLLIIRHQLSVEESHRELPCECNGSAHATVTCKRCGVP